MNPAAAGAVPPGPAGLSGKRGCGSPPGRAAGQHPSPDGPLRRADQLMERCLASCTWYASNSLQAFLSRSMERMPSRMSSSRISLRVKDSGMRSSCCTWPAPESAVHFPLSCFLISKNTQFSKYKMNSECSIPLLCGRAAAERARNRSGLISGTRGPGVPRHVSPAAVPLSECSRAGRKRPMPLLVLPGRAPLPAHEV